MIRKRKRKSSSPLEQLNSLPDEHKSLIPIFTQIFQKITDQQKVIDTQAQTIENLTTDLKRTKSMLRHLTNYSLSNSESENNNQESEESEKQDPPLPTNSTFLENISLLILKKSNLKVANLTQEDFDENLVEVHLEEDDDGYLQYPHMPGMADLYNCTITYRSSKISNSYERRLAGYFFDLPPPDNYPEYYKICTKPMSLTIVKNRLRRKFYGRDLQKLYEDLMLIFRNGCSYYLDRERLIYEGCKNIQAALRRKVKIVQKHLGAASPNTNEEEIIIKKE